MKFNNSANSNFKASSFGIFFDFLHPVKNFKSDNN